MNKFELFDLIGETDENYVLAADMTAKRARPRWPAWAACAACAALIIGAYPVYHALRPQPLHSYTVVEGTVAGITAQSIMKEPFTGGGELAPIPEPTRGSGPDTVPSGDMGPEDGDSYDAPGDAPVEEDPYNQYNSLFENAHLDQYPEWYGGAYIDYTVLGEPSKLVVCIVDGFRTPELEQQIAEWCGEGVWTYRDVKYSRGYLQELMYRLNGDRFLTVVEADKAVTGYGVYEDGNCIRMDCRDIPSDATLAALAEFDPDGDAILVQVHTGQTVNTDTMKGPAHDRPAADPVVPGDRIAPTDGSAALPGGAQEDGAQETPPDGAERVQPVQYDTLPAVVDPPEAKYDLLPLEE